MPRRKTKPETDLSSPVESAIAKAQTLGQLERLAGIRQDRESRLAFWLPFAAIRDSGKSMDAGAAELKRRIRAQGLLPGTIYPYGLRRCHRASLEMAREARLAGDRGLAAHFLRGAAADRSRLAVDAASYRRQHGRSLFALDLAA